MPNKQDGLVEVRARKDQEYRRKGTYKDFQHGPRVLATRLCVLAWTVRLKKQNGRKSGTVCAFYARPCVLVCWLVRGPCIPCVQKLKSARSKAQTVRFCCQLELLQNPLLFFVLKPIKTCLMS